MLTFRLADANILMTAHFFPCTPKKARQQLPQAINPGGVNESEGGVGVGRVSVMSCGHGVVE